jgi:uncharacterized protein YbjT (DUF2867 family)
VRGDVRDPDDVERACRGVRALVSAVTGFGPARDVSPKTVDALGNTNLMRAAMAAGVEHFILISVHQAAPDHPIELFRLKYRTEQELKASGLNCTIVRPTAYIETWVSLLGAPLLASGKTRIIGRGENPINFVAASDVARYVALALTDPAMRGTIIEAGGPDNISMDGLVDTFRTVTGARGAVSHAPVPMMRVVSALLKPVNPAVASLIRAGVIMDTTEMMFDPAETLARYPAIPLMSVDDVIRRDYTTKGAQDRV